MLKRQRSRSWDHPLHTPTRRAFDRLLAVISTDSGPVLLDSGCGTGESTRLLADAFPDLLVIGVDRSIARLSRLGTTDLPHREGNAVWMRGELATLWRLALAAGWRLERHYLLYPNPWPKPGQLQRRWHAHPVFRDMLKLGGRLEMRTNWKIYADEFAFTVNALTGSRVCPEPVDFVEPLSPFERKYRDSGHSLYAVVYDVPRTGHSTA